MVFAGKSWRFSRWRFGDDRRDPSDTRHAQTSIEQQAKKVPLFPTDVTVPKLHIDLVCRPKKYRPYRLTMSCGRRQRPPEVAR